MSAPSSAAEPASTVRIPVFPAEAELPALSPTTITYFHSDDPDAAAGRIKERFRIIVNSNPWLAGRRVLQGRQEHIEHPADIPESLFEAMVQMNTPKCDVLSTHTTYEALSDMVFKHATVSISNKDCAMARLTLCADAASHRLALILSMHHHAADGHTYYRILNMLSDKEGEVPIEALNPGRDEGFPAWVADRFPGERWAGISIIMLSKLLGSLVSRPMQVRVNFVDVQTSRHPRLSAV
jgi:hypothetical protein